MMRWKESFEQLNVWLQGTLVAANFSCLVYVYFVFFVFPYYAYMDFITKVLFFFIPSHLFLTIYFLSVNARRVKKQKNNKEKEVL